MISLKLLLLFLKAICRGYKPALKALLIDGLLRHDKVFVVEARLILGRWKIITVLRFFVNGMFIRADSSILLL